MKLGFRNDLIAIADAEERIKKYNEMVAASYERAKAVNSAPFFGVRSPSRSSFRATRARWFDKRDSVG